MDPESGTPVELTTLLPDQLAKSYLVVKQEKTWRAALEEIKSGGLITPEFYTDLPKWPEIALIQKIIEYSEDETLSTAECATFIHAALNLRRHLIRSN